MPVLGIEDARVESCDLQLGDTWRGMQGKMSVTAPVKKIRKKSDNTQQTQINKCQNEKERRKLENETINQLEELLGTCLAEVKQPDKNGIVREATRQIQDVLKRRRECPTECPLRSPQCLSPVQAGEVSSTQPQLPCAGLHYTEVTTLIEALKHYTNNLEWILLEINAKGEIECISDNVKEFLLHERTELYRKSIFSILHVKDHPKLRPLLRSIQTFNWDSADTEKFHVIEARLLVKNTNGTDCGLYVETVIHAAPVRGSSSEEAGSVMCVIRRCDDASAVLIPDDGGPPAITAKKPHNIVFRLDCQFNILSCDLSAVDTIVKSPVTLVGTRYLDLVESVDRIRVATHLLEAATAPAPPAVSEPFRLRVTPDHPWVRVSARSRLFRSQATSGEPDFIMSTHNVLCDEEIDMLESESPRPAIGGPMLPAVTNGESSLCESRYRSPVNPVANQFSINDFEFEPWASSLLDEISNEDSKDRKDGSVEGQPSTPLTPRAPSTPGENPVAVQPPEEPNRLRSLLSKKPNTSSDANTNSNNRILKDLLKQEDEEATGSETSAPHTPHTPLTPHTPHTPHTPGSALSPLHSASSHAPHAAAHASSHAAPQPTAHAGRSHPAGHHSLHQVHHNNSDVLLKILNDKSDEDTEEGRRNADSNRGMSQSSALLSQLLANNSSSGNGRSQDGNDYLDRIGMAGMKRKFEDAKAMSGNVKRATPDNQQVSSSAASVASSSSSSATSSAGSPATSSAGMSQLCQKNKILVSLLARQQSTPTPPMPLPAPGQRPYGPPPASPAARPHRPAPPGHHHALQHHQRHHSTLSNILTGINHRAGNVNGGSGGGGNGTGAECSSAQSHLQMVLQGGTRYPPPAAPAPASAPPAPLHYANTHHNYNNHPPSSSSSRSQGMSGDSEVPSDLSLSDILDEFIESMPDADRNAADVSMRQRQGMKEKNAIVNAIRQSLMHECETVTKNPSVTSPSALPPFSVQSPVCSMYVGGGSPVATTARSHIADQRARLLQLQRSQQMLVSPEAAEQPQQDLGSTINALVSATPPNVALTRADYHHNLYQTSQIGSNYGTNKLTTSNQNPMLNRQISVPGSGGYAHAAALHTPMSPQPYHRPPRPHPGAGSGAGGGGGGGATGAGGTSAYVRNELRAVVGARSARPDLHTLQPPDLDPLVSFDMSAPEYYGGGLGGGGGGGVGGGGGGR